MNDNKMGSEKYSKRARPDARRDGREMGRRRRGEGRGQHDAPEAPALRGRGVLRIPCDVDHFRAVVDGIGGRRKRGGTDRATVGRL